MEDKFLEIAKKAALEAGKIIQKYAGGSYRKNVKNDDLSNCVTEADIEAEKEIIAILTKAFPEHNIIAEESGKAHKDSKYTWVIDPIDGTISFEHQIPYYSVSIGLLENNYPVLGVILQVSSKDLYWAVQGGGAYLNSRKIAVSSGSCLKEAVMVLDFGHNQKRQQKLDSYINRLITKIGYPYSFGSAVAGLALVGQGMLDAYVNQAYPWDFAAGTVIIREAGGKVTDFNGNEPDWTKERLEVVASNGLIHDQLLTALK